MAASDEVPVFVKPKREILSPPDLTKWEKSQAHSDYLGFVLTLNDAVKGKSMRGDYKVSEASKRLVTMLETMDSWISDIPPTDQPQRFGNKAFRTWCEKLEQNADSLIQTLLPEKFIGASTELAAYLLDGFGNKTRIDYGTGHEACFAAFLCCLFKLRVLDQGDCVAIVFKVFQRNAKKELGHLANGYIHLDLALGHPNLEPHHLTCEKSMEQNHLDYMFLGCIKFINKMKTGPFAEHSNTLWGISSVRAWEKVNSGLIKMYKAEVLSKFPVIQHFVFGTLMSIEEADKFKKPL